MKIILNILTHGDERIGLRVAKEIEKLNVAKGILGVQVANEKAAKEYKRFIDQDLNRSFPGKKRGNYEERLAYRLLPKISSADVVIDIHSTTTNLKDAVIVTKIDKKTIETAKAVGPKYLIYMKFDKETALISSAKVGMAFEYGKDKDSQTLNKIVLSIKRLLVYLNVAQFRAGVSASKINFFEVSLRVPKPRGYKMFPGIKNYRLVRRGQKFAINKKGEVIVAKRDFYPILFGNNSYKDYFGFGATKSRLL